MVRLFFIYLLVSLYSFSATLDEKIEDFVSPKTYKMHKNLIKVLFANQAEFYQSNGNVDIIKVAQTLKTNGLLDIFFDTPTDIEIEFKTGSNSFLFVKVVTDSLKAIGYNFIFTKSAIKTKNEFIWKISLKAEYLIDPVLFSSELNKKGAFINDIVKKSPKNWIYEINAASGFIENAIKVSKNDTVELKKSVDDYFISIPDDVTSMIINSAIINNWHPNIVYFDDKLNILKVLRVEERQQRVVAEIPQGTKYVKINDAYTINNIKKGFEILIK